MSYFLETLKKRNALLYRFGWLCLAGTFVCAILALATNVQVLGINAFIKPMKFFVSITIFCWTMSWYTGYLSPTRTITIYNWVVVVAMAIELIIITGQATLGKLSHFNVNSALDGMLFSIMGIAITVLTGWTGYIGYLFFRLHTPQLSASYLWAIRIGILTFVVFAFEGFMMATRLGHTVGAPDGGAGLPILNWSTRYGDLRIGHFFGMHALQLIPLFGYYIARRPIQVFLFTTVYIGVVSFLLLEALGARPLLSGL
ncbi:hypothetical protein [Spirosoma panaciterrae]|uniref:hypothetical protein n=1 Tax=Spirosoma panaciterrae TaxID=496058 RepID=UPI0003613D81|nr:hypothetical protein [Spirosoma panaciterrae]